MNIKVSDNIVLESATPGDAILLFDALTSNKESMCKWLPFVNKLNCIEDEENFLKSIMEVPEEKRNITFKILRDGTFCGLIGFVLTDNLNHKTEIGYWLLPQFEHKGIMTQSVKALSEWTFIHRNMNRIQIKCATENLPSNAIPKRLGFHLDGTERASELLDSGYVDLNVYSLLKEELLRNIQIR